MRFRTCERRAQVEATFSRRYLGASWRTHVRADCFAIGSNVHSRSPAREAAFARGDGTWSTTVLPDRRRRPSSQLARRSARRRPLNRHVDVQPLKSGERLDIRDRLCTQRCPAGIRSKLPRRVSARNEALVGRSTPSKPVSPNACHFRSSPHSR